MPLRSLLLAVGLGALLFAGCGSENSALIPQNDADRLTELVSEAGDLSAAGDCERARRAVTEAERQLSGLPRKTDARLKRNLKDWLDHLDERIASDCKEPEATASPEPTETASPEPTETASPEPTETASPEPTETASPEPTATASPAPTEEPTGTGGVSPGDG